MYSRLQHHDRTSLIQQSLFFFGISLAIGLGFLFVLLPAFIKFLAFRNISSKITVQEEQVLPSHPTLSQPFEATNSAIIKLSGSASGKQKIILLQNGVPGPDTVAADGGDFTFSEVHLDLGDNTFTAVSENDKGERSNPSNTVRVAYVKDAPKLEIGQPTNDATVTQQKQNPITIKGKTEPGNRIYINDKLQFVSSDGSFSGQFQLVNGDNTIAIKAVNAASVETTSELVVHYQP
ncbi:MAG: hypothetical protein ABI758_06100 [Candidatus Woesebacteria bacterium]